MTRYRLLKDIPGYKKGRIFEVCFGVNAISNPVDYIDNLDDYESQYITKLMNFLTGEGDYSLVGEWFYYADDKKEPKPCKQECEHDDECYTAGYCEKCKEVHPCPKIKPSKIKELESRLPEHRLKGLYYWDDLVTSKINELVRHINHLNTK